MSNYQAGRHVKPGVPDEHAYNLFLSFMAKCTNLGLWEDHIPWGKSQTAFYRLTRNMRGR
jgi:hypothetical protein